MWPILVPSLGSQSSWKINRYFVKVTRAPYLKVFKMAPLLSRTSSTGCCPKRLNHGVGLPTNDL